MRKNLLALSIAAMVGGLSGVANAQVQNTTGGGLELLSFDPAVTPAGVVANAPGTAGIPAAAGTLIPTTTGVGHVLVVPYFSTQGEPGRENFSLLSIVNTDQTNGKAVKLRYRGARNSDDVFDITIYLSPGDIWTANVSVDAEGYSHLVTADNSCTLPSQKEIKEDSNGRFKTNRVRNSDKNETREGYIEILNTADIPPAGAGSLYAAIKHVAGVAPCSADTPATQWARDVMARQGDPLTTTGVNTPALRGYSWPTGGLMANWVIVNTADKASFSGEAVALRATPVNAAGVAFTDTEGAGNIVWAPQTSDNVRTSDALLLTSDPLLLSGAPTAPRPASYDFPDLSTPYFVGATTAVQANALADGFRTLSVSNEYMTERLVDFATDWVFAMPTRRYAVAVDYVANTPVTNNAVTRHFLYGAGGNVSYDRAEQRLCVDAGPAKAFDREENVKTSFVVSPDSGLRFCGEVSVLSFNADKSRVLAAKIAQQSVQPKYENGWFTIRTNSATVGVGLPVVGFAAAKTIGTNLGGTWMHRTKPNAN